MSWNHEPRQDPGGSLELLEPPKKSRVLQGHLLSPYSGNLDVQVETWLFVLNSVSWQRLSHLLTKTTSPMFAPYQGV